MKWFLSVCAAMLLSVQLFAVNINTASVKELVLLKGIGTATAEKIIEYRQTHPFKRVDELMNVKGIGEKKFERIKEELSI